MVPISAEAARATGPLCLGLTGGIGSGKTEALAGFRACGAATLGSDELVHRLYGDADVLDAVIGRFGRDVLDGGGLVDRSRLSARAFADVGGIAFLEALLHPRVGEARRRWQEEQARRRPRPPVLVCEVPLLFEVGIEDEFDAVLVVTAPEAVRRGRVKARGQEFAARSARQTSEEDKIARADGVYVNEGSLADLAAWVAAQFERYSGQPCAGTDLP